MTNGLAATGGRVCVVCGEALVGRRTKYCLACAKMVDRKVKAQDERGKRVDARQARMALLRERAGASGGRIAGMTLSEVAELAWKVYGMSYGRFVGYVHETGRFPPKKPPSAP